MPQPWLENVHRRTLNDVEPLPHRTLTDFVYDVIVSKAWPYKVNIKFYETRDRALMSTLFLTMGRIHEVLKLTRDQFDETEDPRLILIRRYQVGKRKKGTRKPIIDIPIPRGHKLTALILDYLPLVDNKMFNIGRNRAYKIIRYITGYWPHWFRAQSQTYYVNLLGNPMHVSNLFKVDLSTIEQYFRGSWKDHKTKFLE